MSRSRDFVRKIRSVETLDEHKFLDANALKLPSGSQEQLDSPPLNDGIPRVNIDLPATLINRITNREEVPSNLKGWLNAIDPDGAMLASFMYGVMLSEDVAIKERIAMMKEIRDTGHGKPAQPIDQTHTFNPNQMRTAGMSDEDMLTLEVDPLPIPAYLSEAKLPPIPVSGVSLGNTVFGSPEEEDEEGPENTDEFPAPEFNEFAADVFEDAG